jgi:hypothetical protein
MNTAAALLLRRLAQALRLVADQLDPPILTQTMGPARVTYHRT